jgi:hypothetical protein
MVYYSTVNDYDYLSDPNKWLMRMEARLSLVFRAIEESSELGRDSTDTLINIVMDGLKEMSGEIHHPINCRKVKPNLTGRGALLSYLVDKRFPFDLNSEQKKEIEAIFVATYLRAKIIEDYKAHPKKIEKFNEERTQFRLRLVADYPLISLEETDIAEFIYLHRFERAIILLYEMTNKVERKLSLKVGNLLEGTPDSKRYIIGGRSAKDTLRRLDIIEKMATKFLGEDCTCLKRRKRKAEKKDEIEAQDNVVAAVVAQPVISSPLPVEKAVAAKVVMASPSSDSLVDLPVLKLPSSPLPAQQESSLPIKQEKPKHVTSKKLKINHHSSETPPASTQSATLPTSPVPKAHPLPISPSKEPTEVAVPATPTITTTTTTTTTKQSSSSSIPHYPTNTTLTKIMELKALQDRMSFTSFASKNRSGPSAFDIFNLYHVVETNPNIIFINYELFQEKIFLEDSFISFYQYVRENQNKTNLKPLFKNKKEYFHQLMSREFQFGEEISPRTESSCATSNIVNSPVKKRSTRGNSKAVDAVAPVSFEQVIHTKTLEMRLLKSFPLYMSTDDLSIIHEREMFRFFSQNTSNIIQLRDMNFLPQSQVDKMNYFVFEFMEETMGEYYLRKLLPLQSSLTVESNKRDYYRLLYLIMMDITNAVSEIHKKDFVHR